MEVSMESSFTSNVPFSIQGKELLNCLHQLGREYPNVLMHIVSIIEPTIPEDKRLIVLIQMFQETETLLNDENTLQKKMQNDKGDDVISFRLFLKFQELHDLLRQISYLQILHLTNNVIPPGQLYSQLEFLQKTQVPLHLPSVLLISVQEVFQGWNTQILEHYHTTLSETPLHMERQQFLQLEPSMPWELLHFIIEMLKLPLDELCSFQEWISKLPKNHLLIIIQLLQMEPSALLELKRRFEFGSGTGLSPLISNNPNQDSMVLDQPNTVNPLRVSSLMSSTEVWQLRIAKQPPTSTVYHRVLKPNPSVMLVGGSPDAVPANLFVEVTLVRSDAEQSEVAQSLEGNKLVKITSGTFATFKKLKILSTSYMQQGILFHLKFTLKRYVGNVFEPIPGASVLSYPIRVYSHTHYLDREQAAPPPVVQEILPAAARVGSRVVILGSNFVKNPKLRVKFGDTEVIPTFHEAVTLICVVPPSNAYTVPITVSNDGENWCDSTIMFSYSLR